MKVKKLLCLISIATFLTCCGFTSASANESIALNPVSTQITNEFAEPRSDTIETKYRLSPAGRLEYRRWNATKGYWIDPEWRDVANDPY